MSQKVHLKISDATFQRFEEIRQKLNLKEKQSLSSPLGTVLADLTCEIIEQVFGQLVSTSNSTDHESSKLIQTVVETTRKYMPWSVSFLSNERLTPMVNYLSGLMSHQNGQHLLSYSVDSTLITELLGCIEQLKQGNGQYRGPTLKAFTQVVDQGVTSLIREPKKMLKFNMVVDKTLNGVIGVTTQLAYKRFDKLATIYDAQTLSQFFNHFMVFLDQQKKN